jgi:hypothetical protein
MKYFTLLTLLLLSSCSSIDTGNPILDAIYTGTAAVIKNDGAASKCEQGHAQDRINCRKNKQAQVDVLNKSIKKSKAK